MNGSFHAGGESDYSMYSEARRERLLALLHRRFHTLADALCQRQGPLRHLRIFFAWRRTRRRFCRLHPPEDKSRALWLGA